MKNLLYSLLFFVPVFSLAFEYYGLPSRQNTDFSDFTKLKKSLIDTPFDLSVKNKVKKPSINKETINRYRKNFISKRRAEAIQLFEQQLKSRNKINRDNIIFRLGQYHLEQYLYENHSEIKRKQILGKSLSYFKRLRKEYPSHSSMDQILYFMGFLELEKGNEKSGVRYLKELNKRFPQSSKTAESYQLLGEHYFNKNQFKTAISYYQKNLSMKSNFYSRYKLAWSELNLARYNSALTQMLSLEKELSQKKDTQSKGLYTQIYKELGTFFAKAKQPLKGYEFYRKTGSAKAAYDYLREMSQELLSQSNYSMAGVGFKKLIQRSEPDDQIFKDHLSLFQSYLLGNKFGLGMAHVVQVLKDYRSPSLPKYKKLTQAIGTKKATQINQEFQDAILSAAMKEHSSAQKLKQPVYYDRAYRLYEALVNNAFALKEKKKVQFYMAEILYKRKQYLKAAKIYLQVAKQPPQDKLSEESAYNALLSVDKLAWRKESFKRLKSVSGNYTPQAFSESDKRFIEVSQFYLSRYKKFSRASDVLFRIGTIYYSRYHFDKAIPVFDEVATKYPKSPNAVRSAQLLLDIYNIKKDYKMLDATALRLSKISALGNAAFKTELSKIRNEVSFKEIETLERQGSWKQAGDAYYAYFQKRPTDKLGQKALRNAVVSYDKAKHSVMYQKSVDLYRTKFPRDPFSKTILLSLAQKTQAQMLFRSSQKYFAEFYRKYPKDPQSSKALYNSGFYNYLLNNKNQSAAEQKKYLAQRFTAKESLPVLLQLFENQVESNRSSEAMKTLSTYENRFKSKKDRLRLYEALEKKLEEKKFVSERNEVLSRVRKQNPVKIKSDWIKEHYPLIAEAHYVRARTELIRLKGMSLNAPLSRFAKDIERMQKQLVKVNSDFDEIISFGDPEWGVASLSGKVEAFTHFTTSVNLLQVDKAFSISERDEVTKYLTDLKSSFVNPITENVKKIREDCLKQIREFSIVSPYAKACQTNQRFYQEINRYILPRATYWTTRWEFKNAK